jgi:hypothetical protein
VDRAEDPGGLRPSLSPLVTTVPPIVEGYRLWLTGDLDLDGQLDERGYPSRYACPPEGLEFELVCELGWTWAELEATPILVRRLWTDLLMTRRAHEAAQLAKTQGHDRPSAQDRAEAARAFEEAAAAVPDDDPVLAAWRKQHDDS